MSMIDRKSILRLSLPHSFLKEKKTLIIFLTENEKYISDILEE